MRGALTGGRKADRPAVKGDKSKDAPGGYDPEKLNKDWQSRSTPDSKTREELLKEWSLKPFPREWTESILTRTE